MRQIERIEEGRIFWLIVAFQGSEIETESQPVREPA
jgi:hypothetical protein